jgi:ribosomal protein L32E
MCLYLYSFSFLLTLCIQVAASSTSITADYSYATPNELRFMTPSGVRTAAVEGAAAVSYLSVVHGFG